MRTVALVWLAASLSAGPAQAQSRGAAASGQPAIVTIGEAVVRRQPDVAYLTLQIESRAKSSRDAQRQNADTAAAVQKQLAAAGVSRDAQRTLGLQLDQEYDVISGRRVARDFVARNTLEIRIDDVGRAGEIVDSAVQGGATSLQ